MKQKKIFVSASYLQLQQDTSPTEVPHIRKYPYSSVALSCCACNEDHCYLAWPWFHDLQHTNEYHHIYVIFCSLFFLKKVFLSQNESRMLMTNANLTLVSFSNYIAYLLIWLNSRIYQRLNLEVCKRPPSHYRFELSYTFYFPKGSRFSRIIRLI